MDLSLKWFKELFHSSKKEEKEIEEAVPFDTKPYKQAKLVNENLTILTNEGDVIFKSGFSMENFEKLKTLSSMSEIIKFLASLDKVIIEEPKKKEIDLSTQDMNTGLNLLSQLSDFKVIDNRVYFTPSGRTIPPLLVERFIDIVIEFSDLPIDELEKTLSENEYYNSLRYFFLWACLNPRAEVVDELYGFLVKNSFRITKQGFFAALRNVVTVNNDDSHDLVHLISNAYQKIKAVWKKNPDNYSITVDQENNYYLEKTSEISSRKSLGTISELYKNLPEMTENRYTDNYTRTFDIRVGRVVSMPMEECKWHTKDCGAAGLHFTSDEIHYVGCGDTSVLVLINPINFVA